MATQARAAADHGGERELGAGRPTAAKAHAARRVEEEVHAAIRLCFELAQHERAVPHQRVPIDETKVVTVNVGAVTGEFDARTLAHASMRARPRALGRAPRLEPERREGPPIEPGANFARHGSACSHAAMIFGLCSAGSSRAAGSRLRHSAHEAVASPTASSATYASVSF